MKTNVQRTPTASASGMDHVLPPAQTAPFERPLRIEQVCEILGKGKTFLYAQIRQGRLAPPIKMGSRAVFWQMQDLREFVALCIQESR